ncbi:hypothetical protein FOL46_008703 [Perkinsus olseni]|uniref:Uncharacterized protein n=1 Tax=Perkinsus olseni TaxID=32597 RepID=A0A7J6L5M4_PEROL|nr:hypothetical protein FOL46_008703 [Perkinsus olseni]
MRPSSPPRVSVEGGASGQQQQQQQTEGQKVRSSAFASLSKEVNQARLGMLGELMDNRKRAEESEQFFLTRMQQEATSFQHLVQMFEDSLQKVSADLDSRLSGFIQTEEVNSMLEESAKKFGERFSAVENKIDMKAHESSARIACLEASLADLRDEVSKLKEDREQEMEKMNARIEARLGTGNASIGELCRRTELKRSESSMTSRVSAVEEKLEKELCEVQEEMKQGFSTVNGERLDAIDGSLSGLNSRMDAFDSKIDAVDNCIISIQGKHKQDREEYAAKHAELESSHKELEKKVSEKWTAMEQNISDLEQGMKDKADVESIVQRCESSMTDKISTLTKEIDSRFETVSEQMVDFQKACDDQTEESTTELEQLREQLGKVHEVAKSASVEGDELSAKLELKLQHHIDDVSKQVEVLPPRIDQLQRDLQTKLGVISRKLRHLSHCGLNHTWRIDDAVNKLGALGVSAGRFIDSPSFGLGAYKNMQLRFFPKGCGHGPPGAASNIVMQKSAACSVWLVWNPQASNRDARLPPIRVELAVGKSRKGPLEMGHHESLYGCYVWQGNDICVLENELLSSGSLEVSVSIPYRQWYDALELTPDEADFEKDQLESAVTQSVVPTGPMTRGTVGGDEAIGSSRMSVASSAFTFNPDGPSRGNPTTTSASMHRIPETSNPFEQTLPTLAEVHPSALVRPSSATQLRSFSPSPIFDDDDATVSNRGDQVRPQTMNLGATRNPFSTTGSDMDVPTVPNRAGLLRQHLSVTRAPIGPSMHERARAPAEMRKRIVSTQADQPPAD